MRQNTFEKKPVEVLIEQIIEFDWGGLGPLAVHVLLQLVIFMTKQKISKENFRVDYSLLLKYCTRQYLTFPYMGQITCKILPQNARF